MSAIYKIQSQIKPERIYIGSAINIKERWRHHLIALRKGKHHSIKLQRHYLKYGESDLIFSIIELCFSEFLISREQYYFNRLKPYFNICKTAGSLLNHHWKLSDETKRKQGNASKGRIPWNKGKKGLWKHSEETKQKMRENRKGKQNSLGRIMSKETKKKISDKARERLRNCRRE